MRDSPAQVECRSKMTDMSEDPKMRGPAIVFCYCSMEEGVLVIVCTGNRTDYDDTVCTVVDVVHM